MFLSAHRLIPLLLESGSSNSGRNLDLAFLEGNAPCPFDGFIPRFCLDQPEASNQLLCLREWPVGDLELSVGIPDSRALGTRLETFRREQHAGLAQFFIELAHLGEHFLARHHACL